MSNTESNTQLPPPSPDSLPVVGLPLPSVTGEEVKENFLGASNAHMSPIREAQMRANVAAGLNPSGYGRLPGVEAPEFVPELTPEVNVTDSASQSEQMPVDDGLIRGVPEHLKVSSEDQWVPPARTSDITPK